MSIVKRVAPFAVTLGVIAGVTAALWYCKMAGFGPHHPVFAYLLPIALLALLYGSGPATLCAVLAALCAAFFLYDPIYSFQVANRLEYGDLICFTVLALLGVKCTAELSRPTAVEIMAAKPRFGRV
jgi:K+-sensing histidine kinase KdpD